ncbi:MAG TPA: hypothetical protein VHG09_10795 [Longimicrobiales bacterium]|nr:hypothetical protein [Longimicrobiales bacterium]
MSRRAVPDAALYNLPKHVPCPFCDGSHTELHSAFGPQLSVATYWCLDCHTAFEFIKPRRG